MKKFIVKTMAMMLSVSIAFIGAYAFFTASNEVTEEYALTVETEGSVEFTQTATNNGKLAPVTTSGGALVDAKGNASEKYYEATYTVTTPKAKVLKLTDIDIDSELAKAIRVQTSMNGSVREFAPSCRTATNAIGDSVGVVNKTATLTVRIYLEGTDEACIDDNIASSINVGITFAI